MANFISQESIDEVNNRVDIVSIVGEYVPLVQKGDTWWGCCPFHNEKTPSFAVNPSKRLFHCFGCGAGLSGAFVIDGCVSVTCWGRWCSRVSCRVAPHRGTVVLPIEP